MQEARKLTIGMTVFDDWEGFYFTIQAIRMYHKEVSDQIEFIIINTNPESPQGLEVRKFCSAKWTKEPLHYYEDDNLRGTSTRDKIFSYATTPYVLVIDSHVMLEAGSIKNLIDFYDSGRDCGNLIHGPMYYDHLNGGPCKFNIEWRGGMYGTWGFDEKVKSEEFFEIPAQGLGLFSCRKDSWLGFHKEHEKFGGEEVYIHEKYRQTGKKTICLSSLKWLHRFGRPNGVPYNIDWESRFKNYFREFLEIDKPVFEAIEHFKEIGISEKLIRKWISDVINKDG